MLHLDLSEEVLPLRRGEHRCCHEVTSAIIPKRSATGLIGRRCRTAGAVGVTGQFAQGLP